MGDLRRVALYIFDRADADGLAELLETLRDREADPANRGFVTRFNATNES